MPYTADGGRPTPSSEELRARIPGWGADLDPADRPSVPREWPPTPAPGSHWVKPEPQEPRGSRERSIEHLELPPVFGTSVPLRGVSGAIKRLAYRRYSEARAAHWLLLLLGDRVDAFGSHARSFLTTRPDNPITETGVLAELKYSGGRSRFGRRRVDVKHQWLDPIIVGGPWVAAVVIGFLGGRRVLRMSRR
jgi:hypothetical protein